MRQRITTLMLAGLAAVSATAAQAQAPVTVYCSILEEQCRLGVANFEKATGIKVTMVRKSTGETYAQIKAEATNPRGDVWWGGPGDPHMQAAEEGLLDEYRSPRLGELHEWAQQLAEQSRFRTSGIYLGALGIGYNTEVLKKKGLPEPKCWADLLDPKFKDEVQVSDPSSSGTAYVMLASLVQLMGEDRAFDYLKKLHLNVNQYTKSGAAPVKALGLGETGVAIAFMHDMVTQIVQGAPVKTDRAVRGHRLRDRGRIADQGRAGTPTARAGSSIGRSARGADLVGAGLKIYSIPSNKAAPAHADAPRLAEMKLIAYDSAKYGSSAERNRLLKKWDAEVKSLPK